MRYIGKNGQDQFELSIGQQSSFTTPVYCLALFLACLACPEPCLGTARVSCSPASPSPPCWTWPAPASRPPNKSGFLSSTWAKGFTVKVTAMLKDPQLWWKSNHYCHHILPDSFHPPVPASRHHPTILRRASVRWDAKHPKRHSPPRRQWSRRWSDQSLLSLGFSCPPRCKQP